MIVKGELVRNARHILVFGASFALLTAYIYFHASLEIFVIYLLALSLWGGLFGYCVHIREKQPRKAGTAGRHDARAT